MYLNVNFSMSFRNMLHRSFRVNCVHLSNMLFFYLAHVGRDRISAEETEGHSGETHKGSMSVKQHTQKRRSLSMPLFVYIIFCIYV